MSSLAVREPISIIQHLEGLPFWGHLTDWEREEILHSAMVQQFPKESMVHSSTSDCLGMVLLVQGSVRAYLLSQEGREVTLFHLRAGDVCMLSASCVVQQIDFDTQFTAEEDCRMVVVSAGVVDRLTETNIYARCFFYELAAQRFSAVMNSMQKLLFLGLDQRLASFLLSEYRRTGKTEVKMTHEKVAQQISSAREVVARTLKRFAGWGLVEVRRGSIRLLDLKGLEELME